jgi:16S rRNA G1207 methylase RsmC
MDIDALREDLVLDARLRGHSFHLNTTWGLFSPRAVDAGTLLLLERLDIPADAVALDLGCGYGPLGLAIASEATAGQVHMVDRDFLAIEYSRLNASQNGIDNAEIYLSNGFSAVPESLELDLVVSNLPAKVGNEMFRLMFHDAHQRMRPGARIVVVTVNGLRDFVKRNFRETFGNYEKVKQGRTHTVTSAVRE